MNSLTIINQQGKYLVDSREVAVMTEKNHGHLMRDIKGYIEIIDPNPKLDSATFFIESTYSDANSQTRPCFLLTRKGCDMIANKMTGEKGVLFTAAYVTEFERMTAVAVKAIPQVEVDMIAAKYAFEILRPSEASRIRMLSTVCKNHNVNTNFLPSYTEEAVTRSATELLGTHGKPMSPVTFNKRMLSIGLLEEQTRNGKGKTVHKFKALTEAGLYYGKNIVSTQCEREVQPHYYPEKFGELLQAVIR